MQKQRSVMSGLTGPLLCAALFAGCESAESKPDEGGSRGNVRLQDDNNYQSTSRLQIPTVETASAADLEICWGGVVSDLQCHDVAPLDDLDAVALTRFAHLSEEEVEVELTSGQLEQSEVDGYADYVITDLGKTCGKLSSLSFFETPIDLEEEYVESDERTYLMLFSKGTTPGVGARSMIFVRPTSDSDNTKVEAPTGCGMLDFSATLSSLEPLPIPEDGPWVIDWRDVTTDGQGNEVVPQTIDGVLLGFYEGMTVEELEGKILDLELIATESWEIELKGVRTADLARARGRNGEGAFDGFARDEEGTWVLGLMCSSCQNPAPIVLTILEPGEGE